MCSQMRGPVVLALLVKFLSSKFCAVFCMKSWWRLGLGCDLSAQAFWVFFMEPYLTLTSLAMQHATPSK